MKAFRIHAFYSWIHQKFTGNCQRFEDCTELYTFVEYNICDKYNVIERRDQNFE